MRVRSRDGRTAVRRRRRGAREASPQVRAQRVVEGEDPAGARWQARCRPGVPDPIRRRRGLGATTRLERSSRAHRARRRCPLRVPHTPIGRDATRAFLRPSRRCCDAADPVYTELRHPISWVAVNHDDRQPTPQTRQECWRISAMPFLTRRTNVFDAHRPMVAQGYSGASRWLEPPYGRRRGSDTAW